MRTSAWIPATDAGRIFPDRVADDPARALLAFDFDGTLARIVRDPEAAEMVEESAEALDVLGTRVGRIAIISGRSIDSLCRLAMLKERSGLSDAIVLGHYGAERWDVATDARTRMHVPTGIGAAKTELERLAAALPGASVEDKGAAVALHVRRTADADALFAATEPDARWIAQRYGLTVEPGRYVWELRGSPVTKGDALRTLVATERPRSVMMAGDDRGDVAAFEALREFAREGVATCALVSESAEAPDLVRFADVLCDGPDGVARWLTMLAEMVA